METRVDNLTKVLQKWNVLVYMVQDFKESLDPLLIEHSKLREKCAELEKKLNSLEEEIEPVDSKSTSS